MCPDSTHFAPVLRAVCPVPAPAPARSAAGVASLCAQGGDQAEAASAEQRLLSADRGARRGASPLSPPLTMHIPLSSRVYLYPLATPRHANTNRNRMYVKLDELV